MPGYSSGEISDFIADLRAKLGPGSAACCTDLELQVMANQLIVYYCHWDELDEQTRRDLDYAYFLWEERVFESSRSDRLRQLAAELTAKQRACPR